MLDRDTLSLSGLQALSCWSHVSVSNCLARSGPDPEYYETTLQYMYIIRTRCIVTPLITEGGPREPESLGTRLVQPRRARVPGTGYIYSVFQVNAIIPRMTFDPPEGKAEAEG